MFSPTISVCISSVPSKVLTDSRLAECLITGFSSSIPLALNLVKNRFKKFGDLNKDLRITSFIVEQKVNDV